MKYYKGPVGLHCFISSPVDASRYLGMWLDLTTHRQTWLFSSTSTHHSSDLLTARGVAHLVVHGTSGSTSYETILAVRLESSGDVLSTVDMVVQRLDGPRRLKAKFHYTGPTGPDQTRPDPHGLCRRPARTNGVSRRSGSFGSVRVRAGPVGSGRVHVVEFSYKRP